MNFALWAAAALLALSFLAVGATKLAQPKEAFITSASMAWARDFAAGAIKTIGLLEILGAIGLTLPAAVDIAPVLVPLAAAGLAPTMVGAAITHGRRKESLSAVLNLLLLGLAVFVAWGRFGRHSF
ncbi:DoxX family protein [Streptomyces sp. NPDC048179]|uniref:DoxX family protein n=1 Tax=Streptomyces sp. NPDC048179 TaxID=3365506 RepID=UPI00371D0B9C